LSASAAQEAVRTDLESARFRAGCARGQWCLDRQVFPVILVAVLVLPGRQRRGEYSFRFELTDFPTQAPEVKIWDPIQGTSLPLADRPNGARHIVDAFKDGWPGSGPPSVYRPWERHGVNHNNWPTTHPDLTWHAGRDLAFVLEDLYALINSSVARVAAA